MKFTVETDEQRERRLEKWHLWFAWYPVRMSDDPEQVVWLERIERKIVQRGNWAGKLPDTYYRSLEPDLTID